MEKISVIIPVLNDSRFLLDCLQSIFNSTYKNLEVIVVHNYSDLSINSLIGDDYKSDIVLIPTGYNSISAARNIGFDKSTGRLISFFNSFDINGKMRYELCIKRFDNNPGVGMVFCGTTFINEESVFLKGLNRIPDFKQNQFRARMFEKNWINTVSSTLIRADFVKKIGGYDEAFLYAEDYDLCLRICADTKVDYLDLPLVRQRVFTNKNLRHNKQYSDFEIMSLLKHDPGEIAACLSGLYINEDEFRIAFGKVLFKMALKKEALKQFKRSIKLNDKNTDGFFFTGNCYYEMGEFGLAIESYTKCLKLNPDHAGCHNNMGIIYYKQGERDRSMEQFERAAKSKSDIIEPEYNLSCLQNGEGQASMNLSITGSTPAGSAQPKTYSKIDIGSVFNL